MADILQVVHNWIGNNYIELIAFILGIAYVLLALKQNIWCWFVGILNVSLYIYVFLKSGLYGDSALQAFYLVMSIYGWYKWKFGSKANSSLKISRLNIKQGVALLIIAPLSTFLFGYFLDNYTDSSIPYWDGLTTALGVLATWLTARKILENWLVWVGTNFICIGLYFHKSLYLTVVFYAVLMVVAAFAHFQWLKDFKREEQNG